MRLFTTAVAALILAMSVALVIAVLALVKVSERTQDATVLARQVRELSVRTSRDAQVTTNALCVLRHDLERRVFTSRNFLAEHPRGISGISARTIRDGIANQQRTISALSDIDCR